MTDLPDTTAVRDQVWDFLRADTVDDAEKCMWFDAFMRCLGGWSARHGLPHPKGNDVAPWLRAAGYHLAVSHNGSVVILGLTMRGTRHPLFTDSQVPPGAMPVGAMD
ncbi:hypothetical protein [Streptomyces geysiriensis]|uniref:hypothetical protein n=1 Tax=Streptomyces geysiriensis TaxID=68207 RepID=UPI001C7CA4FC|nr:hypothetical protein [Streptomyces geysiriensis]MBX4176403.1 hypothetical protein [Streptomyces geysiriensis]